MVTGSDLAVKPERVNVHSVDTSECKSLGNYLFLSAGMEMHYNVCVRQICSFSSQLRILDFLPFSVIFYEQKIRNK